MSGASILEEHVGRFNLGVRGGNWTPMLELFADDAVLEFVGAPGGPFTGREAIAEAYRTQPPDDEIVLLARRDTEDGAAADYAWARAPAVHAGELRLTVRAGRIGRLVVSLA